MKDKPANTSEKINELTKNRWSPRAFDPDKPVSKEDKIALCEAARWSPSSMNEQPWRFILCDRYEEFSAWEKLLDCLDPSNQRWACNAPLLIVNFAKNTFTGSNDNNRWAPFDTGAAALNLCLEATNRGLFVHQMGGYNAEKVSEHFNVPEEFVPMSIMAVGFIGKIEELDEDLISREKSPRTRKELKDNFFESEWGCGI